MYGVHRTAVRLSPYRVDRGEASRVGFASEGARHSTDNVRQAHFNEVCVWGGRGAVSGTFFTSQSKQSPVFCDDTDGENRESSPNSQSSQPPTTSKIGTSLYAVAFIFLCEQSTANPRFHDETLARTRPDGMVPGGEP